MESLFTKDSVGGALPGAQGWSVDEQESPVTLAGEAGAASLCSLTQVTIRSFPCGIQSPGRGGWAARLWAELGAGSVPHTAL